MTINIKYRKDNHDFSSGLKCRFSDWRIIVEKVLEHIQLVILTVILSVFGLAFISTTNKFLLDKHGNNMD